MAGILELPRQSAARSADAPAVLNALTIDVEDFYHVSAFEHCVHRRQWGDFTPRVELGTFKILDLLERAGVRATFFVLGWVAERQPELVRAIDAAGHEIGCHSYWHRLVYRMTPEEFREDLRRSRNVLEDILGNEVAAYRAPSFSITRRNLWAFDVLIEEGFRFDASIFPTYHDRYGMAEAPLQPHRILRPGGTIWEFPGTVWRGLRYPLPIGGGGYFRLYPYWLTRWGLQAVNRAGRPFVAYLHPWELDPEQPRLQPGRMKAFRHYVNLHRTEDRLAHLLSDFSLGTLAEAFTHWKSAQGVCTWDLRH
jgi:polysaccharide deacetylase family protein (PEP-CTERM system associated)